MIRKTIIGFFILIALISCNTKKDNNLIISPPFNNIEIPSINIKIAPSKNQVARFENGVSVEIPENAFVDNKGNIIQEEVTLTLQTFNSPAEIIASGIPMTFNDDETSGNFESAGMFQITGKTSTAEVFIDKEKELTINYPSQVYGEYDFFQFKEMDADSTRKGRWEKLSADNKSRKIPETNLGTFQLKFASNDYPELSSISSINWKLATDYCNPTIDKNKWVLEQEWSSIEVSEPKFGFGEDIFKSSVNYDGYTYNGAIMVTEDQSRIITTNKTISKIWTNNGELIKTIDKINSDYKPVEILNDKFLIFDRNDGDYICNLDGKELGKLPPCHNRQLANSENIILYNENGTAPTVYLYSITDKKTKAIKLNEDNSDLWNPGIYEHFVLSPKNELLTNSLDGIIIYNLNGEKLKHKNGHYSSISYLTENTLMIEELDGSLTIWNYNTNKEIKSQKQYFNLKRKLIDNSWHYSNHFKVPNTTYIIINEAGSDYSMIWNYDQNEINKLSFGISYLEKDSLPDNFVVGYNSKDEIYHLYNIKSKKDVIKIPNFGYNIYYDGSYYHKYVSPDKSKLLINNSYHSRLYEVNGRLIRDFKNYDSLIFTSGFIKDNLIFTLSEDGIYRLWDKKGNEISSTKLDNSEHISGWQFDNKIFTWNRIFRSLCYYDFSGNMLFNPSRTRMYQFIDSTSVVHIDHDNLMVLKSLFLMEPAIHQLTIRTKDSEFITYVYLDENEIQKINRYYTERAKSILKEKERQEEELKTLRRFKIKEFGIYNWDIIIKQTNYVKFTADFTFDIPTDYTNITIFLITEYNGSAVVKFDQDSWANFAINPDSPNKLLAVLPDNKIAVFNNFDTIDFDKISVDKNFTFEMKTLDEPINKLSDLEKIIEK